MTKLYAFVLAPLVLALTVATAWGQSSGGPETVLIHSGSATLHAMLWRPQGRGPFPGILLNHGSGRTREDLERLGPYEQNAEKLGPVFARHGYVFLYLFRRGLGPSTDQGANAVDLMNSESAAHGQEERNALQMQLLENREMGDALSALNSCARSLTSIRRMSPRSATRLEVRSRCYWPNVNRTCGPL